MDQHTIEQMIKLGTESKARFKGSYGDNLLLCEGVLDGTVFSGDPLRTTLGNTLRVLAYFRYIS